jgi:hypothetical protein
MRRTARSVLCECRLQVNWHFNTQVHRTVDSAQLGRRELFSPRPSIALEGLASVTGIYPSLLMLLPVCFAAGIRALVAGGLSKNKIRAAQERNRKRGNSDYLFHEALFSLFLV